MERLKLGLDIGTNSIGWAVLKKEDGVYDYAKIYDKSGCLMPTKGSYIFPKGTEANEKSKAATRRGFRSSRNRIRKIRLRKVETLRVLSKYGLCPSLSSEELKEWRNKKNYPCDNDDFIDWQRTGEKGGNATTERLKQPYYYRHIAATKEGLMQTKDGRYKLGRAFYHLAQRRGYLSLGEEEQLDDNLEIFKKVLRQLIKENEESGIILHFREAYLVIADQYKEKDKKVKAICNKVTKWLKKETEYTKLVNLITEELNKEANLGKVETGIQKLSKEIKESEMPTLGSYFYSIYALQGEDGIVNQIRGRYIHRIKHYLEEFNYICEKQEIEDEVKEKLYNAIFYQRPLKSQKGLVGKCPLEPQRKRIAISHPLYELFRMWESINRIKIKRKGEGRLDYLTQEEKKTLVRSFEVKNDFEFKKIAKQLSGNTQYGYVRDKDAIDKDVLFNFPLDKTFSGSPTIYELKKVLGADLYESLPLSKTDRENHNEISIEDIWHVLFQDPQGNKDKKEVLKQFALKHLQLDIETSEKFSGIKLKKGYGNLSASAIKKILPFLQEGLIYSHAVFLANTDHVFDRVLNREERIKVKKIVLAALDKHAHEKEVLSIVNNYIQVFKGNGDDYGLGDNDNSIGAFKKDIVKEVNSWFSESEKDRLGKEGLDIHYNECWNYFYDAAINKRPREVKYLSNKTIPLFIECELQQNFPDETFKIEKLFHPSALEAYPKFNERLGNPEISSIKNPVFNKAMHQIKRLVNKLIEEGVVDQNTEINIELAREINSASLRRALSLYQKDMQTIRQWAKEKIIECYKKEKREQVNPTDNDVTKYILYAEQNGKCLYTGKQITPRLFFTEQDFDIEHTIPRSLNNDNSLRNKTLALADFNRNVKKDILPALINTSYNGDDINRETILEIRDRQLKSYNISGGNVVWNVSLQQLRDEYKNKKRAAIAVASDPIAHDDIMTKCHLAKMKLDYLENKYRLFEREEVLKKFTNANLVDTRLITKYARAYLNSYFNRVNVVNGKITDTLRKLWGLQDEYEEKDRSNHIHHCIDATVVACVERNAVNRISEAFHKSEIENLGRKAKMKPPMENFAARMRHLHKEVFIFHKTQDRIKPMLDELNKEKPEKLNLRGPLNNQNAYGKIKIKGEDKFVQRVPVGKMKGKDVDNIVDEGIKTRLLSLAEEKGWEQIMHCECKESEGYEEKIKEHKREVAYKVYNVLNKGKFNKSFIEPSIVKSAMPIDFEDKLDLISVLSRDISKKGLESGKIEHFKINKIVVEVNKLIYAKGLDVLLKQSDGTIILPPSRKSGQMVLKKIRLKSSANKLYALKERRKVDFCNKNSKSYKNFFYYDKEAGSNYEGIIYGDLLPDIKGKIKNRDFQLINHYHIVKDDLPKKVNKSLLFRIHTDDMFLIFDEHVDEINWEDNIDLNCRLFRIVKFNENSIVVLARHNYASGDVDNAPAVSLESEFSDLSGKVLRRRASTLKAIPTKVDSLGRIDVEFSKQFINDSLN
jgi:CRISPR-associated endonuclease Csn1